LTHPTKFPKKSRRARGTCYGFSILEVLVSMFILSLGLLGVAALIPVGKLALVETDKSDRGGACGRAGLYLVESQRMLSFNPAATNYSLLDPLNLTSATAVNPTNPGRVGYTASINATFNGGTAGVNVVIPFAIDPLGVTSNPAYPANILANLGGTRIPGSGPYFPLPRLSLMAATISRSLLGPPTPGQLPIAFYKTSDTYIAQKQAWADQMFRWRDDVTFVRQQDWTPQPAPNGIRPNGIYVHLAAGDAPNGVNSTATLNTGASSPDVAVLPASNGAFSWFATVVPSPAEVSQVGPPPSPPTVRTFNVSVAVCYQRVLTQLQTPGQPDGEQTLSLTSPWATAGFLGGGYGGGTIQLTLDSNAANAQSQLKALANVKNDQWVMLCGWNTDTTSGNIVPVVCQWYRVVGNSAAGNGIGSAAPYYLSLVGPDWNMSDPRLVGGGVSLVIVQGVVGVYTKTIQVDNDLIWTPQ
jgi:hypothetical protein